MKIAIIIPTYNEADNLEVLIEKIIKLELRNIKIVVVDDNSPDGTGNLADKLAKKYKGKVDVVHRKGKLGLGSAYKAGFRKAFEIGADVVITMDADLSHDPKIIPLMIKKIKYYDVVIGSRYVEGGRIIGFSLFRRVLSNLAQILCKFILGLKIYDSTSGFRCYKSLVLQKIKPGSIKSEGYSFLIEVIFRIQKQGWLVKEVPITFGLRGSGKSKVSQGEIFKALLTVARLRTYI